MTYEAAMEWIRRYNARIVEEVHEDGRVRINVVLPNGTPKTLSPSLPR